MDGGAESGVHATLAGVIVGFFVPLKPQEGKSPAKQLEHVLHPWVAFMILPLFAFANAGVSGGVTLEGLTSVLPLGIIAGLFIGKTAGDQPVLLAGAEACWHRCRTAQHLVRLWRSACCAVSDLPCRSYLRRWRLRKRA